MTSRNVRFITVIAMCLSSLAPTLAAGPRGQTREVTALKVTRPPQIDGLLDDDAWRGTALHGSVLAGFLRSDVASLALYQPVAFVAYDDENLYLAVYTHLPSTADLKATGTVEQFRWSDDLIQVFLEPHLNGHFFHKSVNSRGTTTDRNITAATSVEPGRWTLEAVIPWDQIGVTPEPGKAIGFNLVSYQNAGGGEWLSWAAVYGSALKPERFGYLVLGEAKAIPLTPRTPEEDDF